jgi:hypothetical protein
MSASIQSRGLGEAKYRRLEIPGSLSASPSQAVARIDIDTNLYKCAAQGTKDFEAIRKLHSHNYEMIPR